MNEMFLSLPGNNYRGLACRQSGHSLLHNTSLSFNIRLSCNAVLADRKSNNLFCFDESMRKLTQMKAGSNLFKQLGSKVEN